MEELVNKEAEWREKSVRGELTLEDVKEIVKFKRQGRVSAAYAQKASKAKKSAAETKKYTDMTFDAWEGLEP